MKLAAFADVHNRFDAVTRVLQQIDPVDVILIAGDITTNGTPADVQRAIAAWQPFAPTLLAVAGNMDSPAIDQALEQLGVSINASCREVEHVAFFGCSAAPRSIGTPYEISEAEITQRLERGFSQIQHAGQCVVVPHAPPHDTVDRTRSGVSAGSLAIRAFIDRTQPMLVLCGHIHEARGQSHAGPTLVVNCGPACQGHYVLIDMDDSTCRVDLH
jgi:uncharacterized protein